MSDKWVEFYCETKQNKLFLQIKNPYAGRVIIRDELPVSETEEEVVDEPLFDMEQATEMLESFGVVSGLGATLFVPDFTTNTVQILYSDNFAEGFAAEDRVVAGDILITAIKSNM